MGAHLCVPEEGRPAPGLLLLMDAFGLGDWLRDAAHRLASEGYGVVAPDLYYRDGIGALAYDDTERVVEFIRRTVALGDGPHERAKDERALADVAAALAALREQPGVDPDRVGVVGFSLGGRLAFQLACRAGAGLGAAVCMYGGGIASLLDQARALRVATLLLFGGADFSIPEAQVRRIADALSGLEGPTEVHVYPGAPHGFFSPPHPGYHADAAADGWRRTLAWLHRHLGPGSAARA